jgi:hypothetical protein
MIGKLVLKGKTKLGNWRIRKNPGDTAGAGEFGAIRRGAFRGTLGNPSVLRGLAERAEGRGPSVAANAILTLIAKLS